MWATFVLLPTTPATARQDRSRWLSWLDPNERKYEPDPRGLFLPYDTVRPVLNGVACLKANHRGWAADLTEYLLLGFDGSVEFGFSPAISDKVVQGEQVRYFMGVTLLTRLWQLLGFAAEVRSRLGEIAPHLLTVNLGGTGGAALGSFARGWPNPLEEMWDPEELPRCLEPNIQIRRELTASDFEEIGAATAASPPPQIRELAEDVCSAFGVVRPVLLDPRRRS